MAGRWWKFILYSFNLQVAAGRAVFSRPFRPANIILLKRWF
jgi:hypothetical protein